MRRPGELLPDWTVLDDRLQMNNESERGNLGIEGKNYLLSGNRINGMAELQKI